MTTPSTPEPEAVNRPSLIYTTLIHIGIPCVPAVGRRCPAVLERSRPPAAARAGSGPGSLTAPSSRRIVRPRDPPSREFSASRTRVTSAHIYFEPHISHTCTSIWPTLIYLHERRRQSADPTTNLLERHQTPVDSIPRLHLQRRAHKRALPPDRRVLPHNTRSRDVPYVELYIQLLVGQKMEHPPPWRRAMALIVLSAKHDIG